MTKLPIPADQVRFFSGSSNPALAAAIAGELGAPQDETRITRFSNDNLYIQLGATVRYQEGLHCPVPFAAGERSPDGAADDAGHRPQRWSQGRARHHPVLFLRPLGQEGCATHLDHGSTGRRPAADGRRDPRDDDDAIARHILPNTMSFVIVAATISVPGYILGEVVLSFLGVGVQEPSASWGNMLNQARGIRALTSFPWLLFVPGTAIFLTVMAFNFLGDGLRDALDPRQRP